MRVDSPGPRASRGGGQGAGAGLRVQGSRGRLVFLEFPPLAGHEATHLPLSTYGACSGAGGAG